MKRSWKFQNTRILCGFHLFLLLNRFFFNRNFWRRCFPWTIWERQPFYSWNYILKAAFLLQIIAPNFLFYRYNCLCISDYWIVLSLVSTITTHVQEWNCHIFHINPWSTEIRNLNFQSLAVVSRYRDPQLQVTENLCYLWNLSPNIYQCFKIESIFNFKQPVIQVLTKTQNVYCSRHQCYKGWGIMMVDRYRFSIFMAASLDTARPSGQALLN